jgi:putative MATE family efflux protein
MTPHPLLSRPILPTLLRLALPNGLGMVATALVAVAETSYAGRLGTTELAGMALVFPFAMLQQMMSAGAMGGAISSAVARALGARDEARAQALVFHAALIGVGAGLAFSALFLALGPEFYRLLGGRGAALEAARGYGAVLFAGSVAVWLANTLVSTMRGTGDMRRPAMLLLGAAILQAMLGAGFAFGLGPLPRLGLPGIALGQVLAFGAAALAAFLSLRAPGARVRLAPQTPRAEMFRDILRVGALSAFSPAMSVATVLVLTGLVARYGTEALAGYGIGVRLEFVLIPIAFAIGIAAVPVVGTAIGAGDVARARRAAWVAGGLSAGSIGVCGGLASLAAGAVADFFTDDPAALAVAARFFAWVGPAYGFFGLGLTLYFASQGAGRMLVPILAAILRFAVVAGGGWYVAVLRGGQDVGELFAVIALALAAYGTASALGIAAVRWRAPPARGVAGKPAAGGAPD